MRRTAIHYGGYEYVVAGPEDEIRARIDELLAGGGGWLEVNFGQGTLRAAALLIRPGVPVAVIAADATGEDGPVVDGAPRTRKLD